MPRQGDQPARRRCRSGSCRNIFASLVRGYAYGAIGANLIKWTGQATAAAATAAAAAGGDNAFGIRGFASGSIVPILLG